MDILNATRLGKLLAGGSTISHASTKQVIYAIDAAAADAQEPVALGSRCMPHDRSWLRWPYVRIVLMKKLLPYQKFYADIKNLRASSRQIVSKKHDLRTDLTWRTAVESRDDSLLRYIELFM